MAEHSAALSYLIEFHAACGLPMQAAPSVDVDRDVARLRADLLLEESAEFATAMAEGDLVALADALADLVYVAYGAAVTYGIDLDAALLEVHRSNMTKVGDDGRTRQRADGKVLKSARYERPDIGRVLAEQRPLPIPTAPLSRQDHL